MAGRVADTVAAVTPTVAAAALAMLAAAIGVAMEEAATLVAVVQPVATSVVDVRAAIMVAEAIPALAVT